MSRALKLTRVSAGEYRAGAYTIQKSTGRLWTVFIGPERKVILQATTLERACSQLLAHLTPGGR